MKRSFKNCLALSFLLTLGLSGTGKTQGRRGAEPELRITVRVYDHAQVPAKTLGEAKSQATRVFRHAGVGLVWLDCVLPTHELAEACRQPLARTEVFLRVIRRTKASAGWSKSTTGYGIRSEDARGSAYACIFYERVEEIAAEERFPEGLILGHSAAHEIGHLLLPTAGHSDSGIMRARLRWQHWQLAAYQQLLFAPEQIQLIRDEVRARLGLQEAAQLARGGVEQ